jgi:hypothetical protein
MFRTLANRGPEARSGREGGNGEGGGKDSKERGQGNGGAESQGVHGIPHTHTLLSAETTHLFLLDGSTEALSIFGGLCMRGLSAAIGVSL